MTSAQPESTAPARPSLLGARLFLNEFKPIESVIDGLPIPRGGVVSITGPTGSGKTTLSALLQVCLRTGNRFAGREVSDGSVLVLAGENPDDYAMHLMATLQHMGVARESLACLHSNTQFMVIPGTFRLLDQIDWLDGAIARACDNVCAVFVDTSAAFFSTDDENDNVQMRRHASALRELTNLPGNPTVFVLCHPVKSATNDNLLPRGGGAFIAEVDANLTCWKDSAGIVTLHWAGKIRGAGFDPIRFELVPVELEGHVDARGKPIVSVAARHLPDDRAQQIVDKEVNDDDLLLSVMSKAKQGASVRDFAFKCGWTHGAGTPSSSRVDRRLRVLLGFGLVEQDRRSKWRLTPKGVKEAEKLS